MDIAYILFERSRTIKVYKGFINERLLAQKN